MSLPVRERLASGSGGHEVQRTRRRPVLPRIVSFVIFLAPTLLLFAVFRFLPIVGTAGMSLTDYKITGAWKFTGVANYERLVHDPVFHRSLLISLVYVGLYVPMTLVVALATALLLDRVAFWRGFFRGALFLPYVTSFIFAGIIWSAILGVDGLVNSALGRLHLSAIPFLESTVLVLPSLAMVSCWKGFGYSMLILLAGIKSVPNEVKEAALIDGAGGWQRLRWVILPMLRPTVFFVLVIETIAGFQVFDIIYMMTGGGPVRASYTLVYALYDKGFRSFDFGYASSIGVVIFGIVLVVSLLQRRFVGRREEDG